MMALIRYAYVKDDFEAATVEIADLSSEGPTTSSDGTHFDGLRSPRVMREQDGIPIDREMLQHEIEDVYRVLMQIAEEPDD